MTLQEPSKNLRPGLKTWSALSGNKRRPSEYEVVTYKLHWRNRNPDAPYEQDPNTFMNRWYKKNVVNSPLQHRDWDDFRDPDQVTYRAYTAMQDGQEQFVDELLSSHDALDHDSKHSEEWLEILARLYTPSRYLLAAQQMGAAYIAQMAPASTITNAAVFQEADHFRWMSRVCYRTRELANRYSSKGFAKDERERWETGPEWQGYRELMERALATYDWGENLVALNVIAASAVEEGALRQLGVAAEKAGDTLTSLLTQNHLKDCDRQKKWTKALLAMASDNKKNKLVIAGWLDKWAPFADRAVESFCEVLPNGKVASERAKEAMRKYRTDLGYA